MVIVLDLVRPFENITRIDQIFLPLSNLNLWQLEASLDNVNYVTIKDHADSIEITKLKYVVWWGQVTARYLRFTFHVPPQNYMTTCELRVCTGCDEPVEPSEALRWADIKKIFAIPIY